MERFPSEVLRHVMLFLDVPSLFVLLSVCKRLQDAVVDVMRSKSCLVLGHIMRWDDETMKRCNKLDVIPRLPCLSHRRLVWTSLLNLNIKNITCLAIDQWFAQDESMSQFIRNNSKSLKHLYLESELPYFKSYPKIETLTCFILSPDDWKSCPSLRVLRELFRLERESGALDRCYDYDVYESESEEEEWALMVTKFSNQRID